MPIPAPTNSGSHRNQRSCSARSELWRPWASPRTDDASAPGDGSGSACPISSAASDMPRTVAGKFAGPNLRVEDTAGAARIPGDARSAAAVCREQLRPDLRQYPTEHRGRQRRRRCLRTAAGVVDERGARGRFQRFLQAFGLRDPGPDRALDQAAMLRRAIGQGRAGPVDAFAVRRVSQVLRRPTTGLEGCLAPRIALGEFDALDEAFDRREERTIEHERRQAEVRERHSRQSVDALETFTVFSIASPLLMGDGYSRSW